MWNGFSGESADQRAQPALAVGPPDLPALAETCGRAYGARRAANEGAVACGWGTLFKAKAINEVDTGHHRATPASVRHDDDEPPTPVSPCYCRGSFLRRTQVNGVFQFLMCTIKIG